jgi:hypothetical protein
MTYKSASSNSYSISFSLPHPLGAYAKQGEYCATEKGIFVGGCE